MKTAFYLAFLITQFVIASAKGQQVVTYEKYADFEKNVLVDKDTQYVINFWATWCAPCVKELPYFEQLHNENKKVKVVLVSLDGKKDLDRKLIPFIARKKITAQVILLADKDYNSWLGNVDPDWSGAIPATWLVKGNRRQFAEREFDNTEQLHDFVNTFINQ